MKTPEQQMIAEHPNGPNDGSVLDFAADYPGVMVLLVAVLFACTAYFVKRRIERRNVN